MQPGKYWQRWKLHWHQLNEEGTALAPMRVQLRGVARLPLARS